MQYIQPRTVYIDKDELIEIKAIEHDVKTRFINFKFVGANKVLDISHCIVRVYALNSKGNEIFNNLTVIDGAKGIARLELTDSLLIPGSVEYQLKIYDANGGILSSNIFKLMVSKSLMTNNSIEGTNEYKALDKALETVDKINSFDVRINQNKGNIDDNISNIEELQERMNLIQISLEDRLPNETDDTGRLQRTIDKAKDGDTIIIPLNLIVSSTLYCKAKKLRFKSDSVHLINDSSNPNIRFTGDGTLFCTSTTIPTQIKFEGLLLVGNESTTSIGIDLFGQKSTIQDCTLMNFGIGIRLFNQVATAWTGENILKNNFITHCDIALKVQKDSENYCCYDSYLIDNIIHSCRNWIYADLLGNWSINGNHFYSSTPQNESRVIIKDLSGTDIKNNYIELESQVISLFDITIKSSKGGIEISSNKLFLSHSNLITHQAFIFSINCLAQLKNIQLANNMYFSNIEQPNIFLLNLTNTSNACYADINNNSFPINQLFKSVRAESNFELRIAHNEYNFRFSQGIEINEFIDNKKCIIDSFYGYSDLVSHKANGLMIDMSEGDVYFQSVNKQLALLTTVKKKYDFPLYNAWTKIYYHMNEVFKKDNIVTINLSLENGNKLDGTIVTALNEFFRPKQHQVGFVLTDKNDVGSFWINNETGEISISGISGSLGKKLFINCTYSIE